MWLLVVTILYGPNLAYADNDMVGGFSSQARCENAGAAVYENVHTRSGIKQPRYLTHPADEPEVEYQCLPLLRDD